jgi:two-component system, cell cycle sensor histidine kinase and response regulator CckA
MNAIPQTWAGYQANGNPSLLECAFQASGESLAIVENGVILFANQALANLFGYHDPRQLAEHPLAEFVPGSRACTRHTPEPRKIENAACGYSSCEFQGVRRDSSSVNLQSACATFRHADRSLLVINFHDVTQRERRRVTRASDQRFQAIFDAAAIGIVQCTIAGRVLESNPAIARLLGYTRAELRDRQLPDFLHPDDFSPGMNWFHEMGAGNRNSYQTELRYIAKDRTAGWARLTASLVRGPDQAPEFVIAMLEDVTESKQAEQRLRESQKMEAIGRLVGGVAHDFNNLLTGIMLYCDLLRAGLENSHLRHHADEIRVASEHGAALIQQLLAIARQQVVEPQILSLNTTITGMQNLLERLIGEDIKITTQLAPDLLSVKMDPAQAQQIVLNLVLNARDAMPDGGEILLATRNRAIDSDDAKQKSICAELKVSDTGCGMDSETRLRLFEPFFTTKSPGRGNGLGLATVHSIVKQDGGSIDVESAPGAGTQVTICLPGLNQHGTPEQAALVCPQKEWPSGHGTVLLVEDDPAVRGSMHHILTQEGYVVLQARNANEALLACRNYSGRIDLLISDIVLPGMGGHQVAQRVRKLRPHIHVLFTSGYNREAIARNDRAKVLFFRKPFTGAALLKRVSEVLNEPQSLKEEATT